MSELSDGVYTFRLTATDNGGAQASDEVVVTVYPEPINQLPTVDAGKDLFIKLPANTVTISAIADDADGSIAQYVWEQLSGPGMATLAGASTSALSVSDLTQGVYIYKITVSDDKGATASDEVQVKVDAANQPPAVSAGPDQKLQLPENVLVLTATAEDVDGSISSYAWTQLSGPSAATIVDGDKAVATFSDLQEGTYRFEIKVTDNEGLSATDEVKVTVEAINKLPVVDAGIDQNYALPLATLNISGAASDPDGTISTVAWTQVSGATLTLVNTNALTLTLENLLAGRFVFRLSATDNDGAVSYDDVVIQINDPDLNESPTANAGSDQSVNLPTNTLVLYGSGSDVDGSVLTYEWRKISGPSCLLINADQPNVTLESLEEGQYRFRLTVTDGEGATGSDDVIVQVNPEVINLSPTANAGSDQSLQLPTSMITIKGSGSDSDGKVVSYAWSQQSGPASANLANQNTANVTVSGLIAGIYTFRLSVVDDDGATDFDEMQVEVLPEDKNAPPVSLPGSDQEITLPVNTITLFGQGYDRDGTIVGYNWRKLSGPAANIDNANNATVTINGLEAGTYTFRLTVTDDDGASTSADVQVRVNAAAINRSPLVNAGNDVFLTLPTNSTNLNGSASDPDGDPLVFDWAKISGPEATLGNKNQKTLALSNLEEGTYNFRFTATDSKGASRFDDVKVTVSQPAINQIPTANAGPDITIDLPTRTVVLYGSGQDADGEITQYRWTKISGPSGQLTGINSANLTVSLLQEGLYTFRLTVTDNNGASDDDLVRVTVRPEEVNNNPEVNAGRDQHIYLPTNSAIIKALASDDDGSVVSYLWEQTAGPSVVLTENRDATLSLSNLISGVYVFRVTVVDDDGASASDLVRVTVHAEAINQPPTAYAGEDIVIQLPTNTIVLAGSGSDPDGSIEKYQWKKISGPGATLKDDGKPTLTVQQMIAGTYIFRLTVTDNDGAQHDDQVKVTVLPGEINKAPQADAGPDINLYLPQNTTVLQGRGTDSDGSIVAYEWKQVSGPVTKTSNPDSIAFKISDMSAGTYVYRFMVTDDKGSTATDEVTITVYGQDINKKPVALAGEDMIVSLPLDSLVLYGSGTDADGYIVDYQWRKVKGPAVAISAIDSMLILKNISEGIYVFRLRVQDDQGEAALDELQITVLPESVNQNPKAMAGKDVFITLPLDSMVLEGEGNDPDGDPISYMWQKQSGPHVDLSGESTATLSLRELVAGRYIFRLTVTDDQGATDSDVIIVNVLRQQDDNIPPVVYAGEDVEVDYPVDDAQYLVGEVYDEDGYIINYEWRFVDGPTMQNPVEQSDTLFLAGLQPGEYVYELAAMDDDSVWTFDQVRIIVGGMQDDPLGAQKFFSPDDGNQINDEWRIDHLELINGCVLLVFNRFGQKVYETNNYNNDWDGTMSGRPLPDGDYYYVVDCGTEKAKYSGGVRIIRKRQ